MADDIKSIISDTWDVTIIAKGTITYEEDCPSDYIGQGMSIVHEVTDYTPSGMTYKQSDFKSGDIYRIKFIDVNAENVLLRVSALTKICDSFTGNTIYDRLIPRNQEIVWDKGTEERPLPQYRRMAQMPLVATKNNKNLYT